MGTTPPTHACAVCFMNFCAETKFKKGASDRNSHTGLGPGEFLTVLMTHPLTIFSNTDVINTNENGNVIIVL